MKAYITAAEQGYAAYEIQKSKFLAYTAPVSTEEEARSFVLSIKKKHFDARHNCSAWILGSDASLQKSNDDGEPGGTAGNPILEAIKQQGLTDVVVVVTRYFGGIKLGAGGLIRAYNHTAALGLQATPKVAIKPMSLCSAAMDYSLLGAVENWIRQQGFITRETEYGEKVTINLLLEPENVPAAEKALTDLTAARCTITLQPPEYVRVPI